MVHPVTLGISAFESRNRLTPDKCISSNHLGQSGIEFGLMGGVLGAEVDKRDTHEPTLRTASARAPGCRHRHRNEKFPGSPPRRL